MKYTQLTKKERYHLELLIQEYSTQKMLAEMLGRSRSTISRELRRNKGEDGRYRSEGAISKTAERRKRIIPTKFTELVKELINEKLELGWSPEQISGRLKIEYNIKISYELIYQYIDRDRKIGGTLFKNLPHRGKKYKKRNIKARRVWKTVVKRKPISDRPTKLLLEKEIGHWEGDTVESKGHRGGIGSFLEMKSKFTIIRKVRDKSAEEMKNAVGNSFASCPGVMKTLTLDNGNEFALHDKISKETGATVYFAEPYSPWERGLNENTNGLIRRFYPKGTDFNRISEFEIANVQNLLNERPRKILGFRTPKKVFIEEILKEEKFRLVLNVH